MNGTIVPEREVEMRRFEQTLAESVRTRRVAEHLTQADLADLAGVSERFVRSVERGKSTVRLESLLAVLRTLGLDLAVTRRGHDGGSEEVKL